MNDNSDLAKDELAELARETKLDKGELAELARETKLDKGELAKLAEETKLDKDELAKLAEETKLDKDELAKEAKLEKNRIDDLFKEKRELDSNIVQLGSTAVALELAIKDRPTKVLLYALSMLLLILVILITIGSIITANEAQDITSKNNEIIETLDPDSVLFKSRDKHLRESIDESNLVGRCNLENNLIEQLNRRIEDPSDPFTLSTECKEVLGE